MNADTGERAIGLLLLIDTDPPSAMPGGRGFYPAADDGGPPDLAVMQPRLDAIRAVVRDRAQGKAVLALHTSPRYRDTYFDEPYLSVWRDLVAAGAALVLHPHEDRADGTSLYDDPAHIETVIVNTVARAETVGLRFAAFRSGGFCCHADLPALLCRAGLRADLSAAHGMVDAARHIDWPAAHAASDYLLADADSRVVEVPLGWDGEGDDFDRNYLFNERMDLAGLCRVWDAIRRTADRHGRPRAVNFLTHGFGLVEPHWRHQALAFLDHAASHGGRLVDLDEAVRLIERTSHPPQIALRPADAPSCP